MEYSHKDYNTNPDGTQAPFRIDEEFKNKIPAMPKEDFEGLKADIVADGYVRDPLVAWEEENTLVDGHHRWQIIQENWELLKDNFTVVYKNFPDRWAAIAWICANQLHKHNMTKRQRDLLINERYEALQHSEAFKGNQYTQSGGDENHHQQNGVKKNKTRKLLADELKTSEWAIQKAVEVGRGVEKADKVVPGFKNKILSGAINPSDKELSTLRNMNEEEIVQAVSDIYDGKKPERKPRKPKTEEEKRDMDEIETIIRDMRDPTTTPEFTIDFLIEDIELNGQTYVELLTNTIADRKNLVTDENKPLIVSAINKVVDEILKVRDSM